MSRREPLATFNERSRSRSPTKLLNNQSGSPQPVKNSDRNTSHDRRCSYIDSSDEANEADESIDTTIDTDYQTPIYKMESWVPERSNQNSPNFWRPEQEVKPQAKPQQAEPCRSSHKQTYYAFFVFVMSILVTLSYYFNNEQQVKVCKFEKLRQKKPLQSAEVWDALQTNIELLLNKQSRSPNVFLLLHSNKSSQMKKLIQEIAVETSKCFDGQRLIEMSLQDFETKDDDDYGYPIEQYKQKLKEGNVFLIVNLNDIPPKAARALHTICETYDPIEPDVVIFLTLSTNQSTADVTPANLAYNTLHELWKDMPDNELGALITRVIDQVLLLKS